MNLFFVMCRQATCRQMEALHLVAVNIIATISKRFRKTGSL